jgi:deazaflavin-dependent oxidoreductase (nitroreductase family)
MAEGRPYLNPGFVMKSIVGPLAIRSGRLHVLTVEGRTSGKPRSVPIGAPVELDGHKYLVSGRGHTHWILNLRAAGCGTLRHRGVSESFRAVEVDGAERERVIAAYRAGAGKMVEPALRETAESGRSPDLPPRRYGGRIGAKRKGRLT